MLGPIMRKRLAISLVTVTFVKSTTTNTWVGDKSPPSPSAERIANGSTKSADSGPATSLSPLPRGKLQRGCWGPGRRAAAWCPRREELGDELTDHRHP